jgi:RNA polymerase primary sigma factor
MKDDRRIKVGRESGTRFTMRNDIIDKYMNEISKYKVLTSDEEFELAVKSANGDLKAREAIVLSNLRFVISVVKVYSGNDRYLFEDLINEGNMGLVEAAETYNPNTGFKFISYAVWFIRKNISKYFANTNRMVRLPMNKHNNVNKMREIENQLSQELQRDPSFEEIFERLDQYYKERGLIIKPSELKLAMAGDARSSRLEGETLEGEHEMIFPIDRINGDINTDLDKSDKEEAFMYFLNKELDRLTEKEREIFKMKHGISPYTENSFSTIAEKYEITGQSVRLICKRIESKLKKRMEKYFEKI